MNVIMNSSFNKYVHHTCFSSPCNFYSVIYNIRKVNIRFSVFHVETSYNCV